MGIDTLLDDNKPAQLFKDRNNIGENHLTSENP